MQLDDPLVSKLHEPTSFLNKTFSFNIGSFEVSPEYWHAITIVVLLFLIVFSIARWRHLYVKWNLQGFLPSVALGFMIALIAEGFLLIGGRTLFTEILGWENAPKPISTALDEGRTKLVDVLGVQDEIPLASADQKLSADTVISEYELLSSEDSSQVKKYICEFE